MVGYNQDMLKQKAKQYGFQGEMADFPKYLQQNAKLATRFIKEQNQGIDTTPRFQAGGMVSPAVVYPPGVENPYAPPPQYLTQPMPPPEWTPDPNLPGYKQMQSWIDENWERNPAYDEWAASPHPMAHPADSATGANPTIPSTIAPPPSTVPTTIAATTPEGQLPQVIGVTGQRLLNPVLPYGTQFQAAFTPFEQAQNIDPATGQVARDLSITDAAQVPIAQTTTPTTTQAAQVAAAQTVPDVQQAAAQAQQLGAPTQTIEAQQQAQTQEANLQAAQLAQASQIQAPADRALQAAEQISGPAQQAVQAAAFVEPSLQAAQANPSLAATVQGQLAILSEQFVQGEVPFWAAGAVRAATQKLEARGLGASSMTAQAIVQASLEAALPIAQADARTIASFEAQNLTNRQQSAMLTGQYRAQFLNQEFDQAFQTRVRNAAIVSDIANRNFTADQQIALENAKFAQTVDLSNLSNEQALVMANASALANLDISNLNNRQQSAVQNAQNFLQLDMSNLNNQQQAAVLNSQQQIQSILSDAAAENTARQINATNQQQTDQFYSNLIASVAQNNTTQSNAMNQFNAGEVNALQKFNSEVANQRDQFNARNQLAIEQSNAVWRREIATSDTASLNFQNQFNAQNLLDLSSDAYDNLWQEYRDIVEFAFTGGENQADRFNLLQLAAINNEAQLELQEFAEDSQNIRAIGGFASDILSPIVSRGMGDVADWIFGGPTGFEGESELLGDVVESGGFLDDVGQYADDAWQFVSGGLGLNLW